MFWICIVLLDVLPPENQLKSILNLWFGPSKDEVSNLPPLVANSEPFLKEVHILFKAPLAFVDGGVQSSQPSLPALLTIPGCVWKLTRILLVLDEFYYSIIQLLGNTWPVLGTIFHDKVMEDIIFVLGPLGFITSKLLNK